MLFCDLWGCLHNGVAPYPEAVAALQAFRMRGGRVVLMTNAPRPAPYVREQLDRMGVPRDAYDLIVSSGDAAQDAMFAGAVGRKVWAIAQPKDEGFFTDIPDEWQGAPAIERVELDQAQGIVCCGLFDDLTEVPEDYRARLMLEVTRAVIDAVGHDRVGIRLSPVTPANGIDDAEPQPLFDYLIRQLAPLGLAYIHVIEGATGGPREVPGRPFDYAAMKGAYRQAGGRGAWMVNNGYDPVLAEDAVASGRADLVAFGKAFISMPDLAARIRHGGPYQGLDKATMYGGGAQGYTDYPTLGG